MRLFLRKRSHQIPNTDFVRFLRINFQPLRQMFLFCFTRVKEFEPSRRVENSVPGFVSVVVSTAAGRTRRAAAQLN